MKVSVIIPVYNGEKYITQAILSALEQTYKDTEIIIVDDASTDKTPKIIQEKFKEELQSGKIRYFRNQSNKERSYTRNRGFQESNGEYIFFLDYDDVWESDYIENSIKELKNFDIVYSFPRTFIDENGNIKRVSKKKIDADAGKVIFSGNIGYPSASGFKRDKFLKFREDLSYREDWELFLRSYLNDLKIKILDNNKIKIREHANRTSKNNIEMMLSTLKLYKEYKDRIPKEYKDFFYFHVGEMCLRFGNLPAGWHLVIKSFKNPEIFNKRNIINLLKWGFRLDRFISYLIHLRTF